MSTDLEATLDARGYYVALDVPSGATFGMDTATWTTGDEFAGVKAVPVGVHLVTIRAPPSSTHGSAGAEDTVGEFIDARAGWVDVRKWDAREETLGKGCGQSDADAAAVRDAAANAERRALDARLAWYPREIEDMWVRMSGFVTRGTLRRCGVDVGTRIVAGDPDADARRDARDAVTPYFEDAHRAATFTVEATSRQPSGKTPAEVSAMNLDANVRLEHALGCFEEDGWRGLLGEFQLAFVLLMALSSMEALEQWKRLTHVVCSCAETAVFEHPELYSNFIDALDAQLGRAGEDFFVDDYSEDNFLRPCLVSLMRVDVENDAPESDVVDVDAQRVLDSISGKLEKLAKDVKKKFDVDLVEEAREQKLADAESGEGEDGPVVVELSEGIYMSMEGTNLVDEGSEDGDRSEPALETNQNAERMSWMFPGQPPP